MAVPGGENTPLHTKYAPSSPQSEPDAADIRNNQLSIFPTGKTVSSRVPPQLGNDLKKIVHIHIGEYYASRKPAVIYTLLGSCVTVCLYDPVAKIGGMNHILMPGKADMDHFDAPARYGINAMELLINRIMNLGGNRRHLIAKVFGGARTISTIAPEYSMGRKNVEFALTFLERESIKIAGSDMGGIRSRRVFFNTGTGEAFLKKGRALDSSVIVTQERVQKEQISRQADSSGDIMLF